LFLALDLALGGAHSSASHASLAQSSAVRLRSSNSKLGIERSHARSLAQADIGTTTSSDASTIHSAVAPKPKRSCTFTRPRKSRLHGHKQRDIRGVHVADCETGLKSVLALLDTFGADAVDARNKRGDTVLHIAAAAGHMELVRALVRFSSRLEVPNQSGYTPLLLAARDGHAPIVQVLLEAGASINARTIFGDSAGDLARLQRHDKVLTVLKLWRPGHRVSFLLSVHRLAQGITTQQHPQSLPSSQVRGLQRLAVLTPSERDPILAYIMRFA